ncbi:MAG: Subtilase family protein [Candidatus Argoarchaeum ethanivorans]|uniref:Subtilase family protein n=1 Tax=Candidatus Argoarchaeum ethanivorans TaxID=2608793 RepID=A0A812A2I4_9EURY|nr:MAG: Subtilase family protein [Candidatus Argoarchaeum ethanivorans]
MACDAAVDAGIVVSVAAGNAGMWGSKTVGDPACAKKVITVGAIDDDMDIAYFSSRGSTADGRIKPEVCAVGVDVTSAEAETGNGYVPHSGTSMATHHVAGVAALMLEYNPNLAPLEVREILMDTTVDRGVIGPDNEYGWGVVDAMFALPMAIPQDHDIKVSNLQTPDYVKPNDTALVNATVCNIGMNNETNITVELIVNGTVLNSTTIPFIENGTNTLVYFTWSAPSIEGMCNLTVYAVPVQGENITINNQKTKRVSVTSAKPIALFKDRDSWGYASNEEVLLKYGLPYTVFTSSDMGDVNLSEYGKIVIASQQSYSFYFKIEQNRPWFEAYISNGSVFELHGAEWGCDDWSGLIMPGGFTSMFDTSNDVTVNMLNHVILNYPNVITTAELDWWNYATHGWLTNFSIKPITIITQEPTRNPCLVEFLYGDGYVVATMQTLELAYAHEYSPFLENVILYLPVRQEHDILVGMTVPEVLKFNETNNIGANVWNLGLFDETNVAINFTVDGILLDSKTIPFIQNETDTTVSFNWTPTAVGWYNVSVYTTPVPGEDCVVNNLATRYVEVPKAVLIDVYADYGIDLDGDGLYNYLAIDVGVNVAEAGYYYLYGNLETLKEFYITSASNNTYLPVGKQNITLLFNGIDIRRIDLNGPYTLSNLRLRDNYWNTVDKRLKAYNTSFYDSKEFQLPKAMFTDVYNDTGVDTDNDGYYNYLSIDIGVNVSESGYYHWYGELYDGYGESIAYEGNSSYLENGTQIIQLNFDGFMIRKHNVDGPYYLKYLRLYDDDYVQQDGRHDAYVTSYYEYIDFQPPSAEFNDVYSGNGTDTDGDGLYDYLTIDVGVNVTKAGNYRVEGRLDDCLGGYIEWRNNYTYLNTGNQTVKLDFEGIKIRQNEVNGTFDLKYLYLYNTTDWTQLDYIYEAYTTSYYNYTDFQKPPAEFNDVYSDYGEDTDVPPDGFNNSLVINVGVNVTKAGRYQVSGSLYENGTWQYITGASNTSYLSKGNQTVQFRFDGVGIRQNEYNGTYDLRYLNLYNATYPYPVPVPALAPVPVPVAGEGRGGGEWASISLSERELEKEIGKEEILSENVSAMYWEEFDHRRYAYTTKYYNWTEFQKPPAEFALGFNDYGLDTNNNSLYDYLVIEKEIEVRKAGNYKLYGSLRAPTGKWIDSDSNYTYLGEGLHNVTLKFYGPSIYLSGESDNFDVYMDLYDRDNWRWLDWETNTTSYYYSDNFERPPAEFTANFSDYGLDTDNDTLYNHLVMEAEINVTTVGEYELSGSLQYYNKEKGYWEWISDWNRTHLDAGIHNITLQFDGIRIYSTGYNGSFRTWLRLYETKEGKRIDEMEYFTNDYNYTDFQKPPVKYIDAAIVLEMAVRGKWSVEADINQDGRVSSLDALMILQAEFPLGGKIQ